jgi:hypothetical protein
MLPVRRETSTANNQRFPLAGPRRPPESCNQEVLPRRKSSLLTALRIEGVSKNMGRWRSRVRRWWGCGWNPGGVASPVASELLSVRVNRRRLGGIGQICHSSQTDHDGERDKWPTRVRDDSARSRRRAEESARLEHCHHRIFGQVENFKCRRRWPPWRKSARCRGSV